MTNEQATQKTYAQARRNCEVLASQIAAAVQAMPEAGTMGINRDDVFEIQTLQATLRGMVEKLSRK